MKRSIRFPDDLDAEIVRRGEATHRSFSNSVIALLYQHLDLKGSEAKAPEPLPKIAPRR